MSPFNAGTAWADSRLAFLTACLSRCTACKAACLGSRTMAVTKTARPERRTHIQPQDSAATEVSLRVT